MSEKIVVKETSRKVWWKCAKHPEHQWETTVKTGKNSNCPYCSVKKSNLNPELAKEWHPTKNGNLSLKDIVSGSDSGSGKKVWWKCENGHEWVSTVKSRIKSNCPYCISKNKSS